MTISDVLVMVKAAQLNATKVNGYVAVTSATHPGPL
jgi:hypothetical protein